MAYKYNYFSQEDPLYLHDNLPYNDTINHFKNIKEEEEEKKRKQQALLDQAKQRQALANEGRQNWVIDSMSKFSNLNKKLFSQNEENKQKNSYSTGAGVTENYLTDKEEKLIKDYYDNLTKDVSNFVKGIDDLQKNNDATKITDLTRNNKEEYQYVKNLLNLPNAWASEEQGQDNIATFLAYKYFGNDEQKMETFMNQNTQGKIDMLAAIVQNNPFYKTDREKLKESVKEDINSLVLFRGIHEWQQNNGNRVANGNDSPIDVLSNVFTGVLSTVASTLTGPAKGLLTYFDAMKRKHINGELKDSADDLLTERADRFLNNEALKKRQSDTNTKDGDALTNWFELSEKVSNEYKANKDNALVSLNSEEDINNYYKYQVRKDLFGEDIANQQLQGFWKDIVAKNLGVSGRTGRAIANNVTSFTADLLCLTGVALAVAETPYAVFAGYDDVWLNENNWAGGLIKYGTELQETGAFNPELQRKWKELGLSALQQYRTREQESEIFSTADFFDAVGQYGFTAATILASFGGSALLKTLTKGTTNAMARQTLRALGKGEALNVVLNEASAAEEVTKAMMAIQKLQNNIRYYGNLGVAAFMGTGEGALEARSTYDTFLRNNRATVEGKFDKLAQNITRENVIAFLNASNIQPELVSETSDGSAVMQYSERQLNQGKAELLRNLQQRKDEALQQLQKDASKASLMNLCANSAINGFLMVAVKDIALSADTKNATRRFRNKRKWQEGVEIDNTEQGFRARVKNQKPKDSTKKKSIMDYVKGGAATAYYGSKQAFWEGTEEYFQTISDDVSRAIFEQDLDTYLNSALDTESQTVNYATLGELVRAGLNAFELSAESDQAFQAFRLGFVSTAIGGLNPTALVTGRVHERMSEEFAKNKAANKDRWYHQAMAAAKGVSELWSNSFKEGLEQRKYDKQNQQRLVDWVNSWLQDEKYQNIIRHLGSAAGFKAAWEQALADDNIFDAKNNFLGLSLQSAIMIQDFIDTEMGKSYMQKLEEMASLQENAESSLEPSFNNDGSLTDKADDFVIDAVKQFKTRNLGDNENTGMTDREIVERLSKNANEFLEFYDRVANMRKQIHQAFADDNLDPIAEEALVHAYLVQEDSIKRAQQLADERESITTSSEFSEGDGNIVQNINDQHTTETNLLNILSRFGSIKKAKDHLKQITSSKNVLIQIAESPQTSKQGKKNIEREISKMDEEYNHLENMIDAAEAELETRATANNVSVTQSETVFTERDILNMTVAQRSIVMENRKNNVYSEAQNRIIDSFIERFQYTANLLESQQNGKVLLNKTKEEVQNNLIDEGKLESKKRAYNNMLADYMNRAEDLNNRVAGLRKSRTKEIMRNLYRTELTPRENENLLDYVKRLDKRLETIRETRGDFEYSIFKDLLNEQKEYKQFNDTEKKIEKIEKELQIQVNAQINSDESIRELSTDTQEQKQEKREKRNQKARELMESVNKAIYGLKTLACAGWDYNTIHDYINKSDKQSELSGENGLRVRRLDGEFILEHMLKDGGYLNQDATLTDDIVNEVLNCIKQMLVKYDTSTGGFSEGKQTQTQTQGQSQQQTGQQGQQQQKATYVPPTRSTQGQPVQATRRAAINIIAGEYKLMNLMSEANKKLKSFLETFGLSQGKLKLKASDNIFFVVASQNQPDTELGAALSNVVLVVRAARLSEDSKMVINNVRYIVVGAIDMESTSVSQNMRNIFNLTKNAMAGEKFKMLESGNTRVVSNVKRLGAIAMFKRNFINFKNIADLSTVGTMARWIVSNIRNFKIEYIMKNGKKIPSLRFGNLTIAVKTKPNTNVAESIFNLQIGQQTIKELVQTGQMDTIFGNSLFGRMLKTWKEFNASTKSNEAVYKQLIEAFIYNTNPNTDKAIIQVVDPQNTFNGHSIKIKLLTNPDEENNVIEIPIVQGAEEQSIESLLKQFVENEEFLVNIPQIDYGKIANALKSRNNLDHIVDILNGLYEMDALFCQDETQLDREITVSDPFNEPIAVRNIPGLTSSMDPEIPSTNETASPDAYEARRQQIEQKKQKAREFIEKVQQQSESINLQDDNSDSNVYIDQTDGTQKERARVTALEDAQMDQNPHGFTEQEKNKGVIAQAHGNIVDDITRTFIKIFVANRKSNKNTSVDEIIEELKQTHPDGFFKRGGENGQDYFYLYKIEYIQQYIEQLIEFGKTIPSDWELYPVDVRVRGSFNVVNGKNKVGTIPVAGTLDLLVIDSSGNIGVIDIKTKQSIDTWFLSVPGWRQQTFSYTSLLKQMVVQLAQQYNITGFDQLTFTQPYILLSQVFYAEPTSTQQVTLDASKRMLEDKNVGVAQDAPKLAPLTSREKAPTYLDFLIPIEEPENITTDVQENRIPEPLQHLIERTPQQQMQPGTQERQQTGQGQQSGQQGGQQQTTTQTQVPEPTPQTKSKRRSKYGNKKHSVDGMENPTQNEPSQHTQEESRKINFLNTRLKPVTNLTVNLISRIKRDVKAMFNKKGKLARRAVLQDLAITFFDGKLQKFNIILGKINILDQTEDAVAAIKNYFEVNINKKKQCIDSITRRHTIAKQLYLYLKDEIAFDDFMEQMSKINASPDNISELAELQNSQDIEGTKKAIIRRIEASKMHDTQYYNEQIKNLDDMVDDMQLKLDFLNTPNSVRMIKDRINSILYAIRDGQIIEEETKRSQVIEDILKNKKGVYNARMILAAIQNTSQNAEFKLIAKRLQNIIANTNQEVRVLIDDTIIGDTEGQNFGLCIRILNKGLENKDTFERTVLHELIHSLVTDSEQVKKEVQIIMDEYLNKLSLNTGVPVEQLKQQIYGFANVTEFVTEFFTNMIFQETLRNVSESFDEEKNFFERIANAIIGFITGRKTSFDKLYYSMNNLFSIQNLHQQISEQRLEKAKKIGRFELTYDALDSDVKAALNDRGITKNEFETLPALVQEQLVRCC